MPFSKSSETWNSSLSEPTVNASLPDAVNTLQQAVLVKKDEALQLNKVQP